MADPESFDERRLDRRHVLGLGLGALATYALGLPLVAAAANRVPVWRLDPVHSQGAGGYSAGCTGCRACRLHAQNKIFATKAAAAEGKAHPNCNCRVVRTSIPEAAFVKMFGPAEKPTTVVFDRRWKVADRRKAAAKLARSVKTLKKAS